MSLSHLAFCYVRDAIVAGRVVHAAHPDFGGTVTVAMSIRRDASPVFETVSHGGSVDVGMEHHTPQEAARYFVGQVGKRNALPAAMRALEAR